MAAFIPVLRQGPLLVVAVAVVLALALAGCSDAQLSAGFNSASCPSVHGVVRQVMSQAVMNDPRSGAAILRLFFHDCFVNVRSSGDIHQPLLLRLKLNSRAATPRCCSTTRRRRPARRAPAPTPAARRSASRSSTTSRRRWRPPAPPPSPAPTSSPSPRATASTWSALSLHASSRHCIANCNSSASLSRSDSPVRSPACGSAGRAGPCRSAGAATDLPGPRPRGARGGEGLTSRDLAALSGAHTVGMARCAHFRTHVYCDANVSQAFASRQQQACPASGGDGSLAPLDSLTPAEFDNGYYRSLMSGAGLLHSDQELFNNGPVDSLVRLYSANADAFSSDFAASMVRLGNISPLTGTSGEIRLDCRKVNS